MRHIQCAQPAKSSPTFVEAEDSERPPTLRPRLQSLSGALLPELARVVNYHPGEWAARWKVSLRQLRRECWRVFGCSPRQLLCQQRIAAVERSLPSNPFVKGTAEAVGFQHSSNFCRWFKAQKQMSALEFAVLPALLLPIGLRHQSATDASAQVPLLSRSWDRWDGRK